MNAGETNKSHMWEWLILFYTTYKNGDDWGVVLIKFIMFMALFYPHEILSSTFQPSKLFLLGGIPTPPKYIYIYMET